MTMKLYVGNLPYNITENELEELFHEFGSVESVKIVTDRESGRSRGFGFLEMSSREEGENAIEALNNKVVKNRSLVVNEARPRKERKRRSF